jgi:hypothetical protein
LTFPETGEIIDIASKELFSIGKEDFLGIIDLNSRSGEIGKECLDRAGGLWQAGFRMWRKRRLTVLNSAVAGVPLVFSGLKREIKAFAQV